MNTTENQNNKKNEEMKKEIFDMKEQLKVIYKKKESLGENHPDTLEPLADLALCYHCLKKEDKAFQIGNTIYNKRKKILGEKHPDTLNILYDLSVWYSDINDYSKAIELANEVYEKRKETLGIDNPDTLKSLSTLETIILQ